MVFFILRLSLKVTEETLIEHRLLSLTEAGDVLKNQRLISQLCPGQFVFRFQGSTALFVDFICTFQDISKLEIKQRAKDDDDDGDGDENQRDSRIFEELLLYFLTCIEMGRQTQMDLHCSLKSSCYYFISSKNTECRNVCINCKIKKT